MGATEYPPSKYGRKESSTSTNMNGPGGSSSSTTRRPTEHHGPSSHTSSTSRHPTESKTAPKTGHGTSYAFSTPDPTHRTSMPTERHATSSHTSSTSRPTESRTYKDDKTERPRDNSYHDKTERPHGTSHTSSTSRPTESRTYKDDKTERPHGTAYASSSPGPGESHTYKTEHREPTGTSHRSTHGTESTGAGRELGKRYETEERRPQELSRAPTSSGSHSRGHVVMESYSYVSYSYSYSAGVASARGPPGGASRAPFGEGHRGRSHLGGAEERHPFPESRSTHASSSRGGSTGAYNTEERRPGGTSHTSSHSTSSSSTRGGTYNTEERRPGGTSSHTSSRGTRRESSPPRTMGKTPEKSLYEVLGVSRNASADEIKKAYRSLCMKWHPDRVLGTMTKEQATRVMMEINQANDVLSDAAKRAFYDRTGMV